MENRIAWLVMLLMLMGGCAALKDQQRVQNPVPYESYAVLRAGIVKDYGRKIPQEWGETLLGVKTDLATDLPVMALTFDACGGACGSGYDAELIDFLERQQVPATLFMNGRWIDRHWDIVRELSDNPLFEIENHGRMHKPCSVSGRAAYGIPGTAGVAELVDEVEINARMIEALTGSKPRYYRPGTAYCDEIGVQVVHDLGYEVAGYNVLGDAGATYSCDQVREALLAAPPGAIVLMHMNHPDSGTREGLMQAIPLLKQRGVRFIRLCEYYPPFNPETAVASESSRKENNQPGW